MLIGSCFKSLSNSNLCGGSEKSNTPFLQEAMVVSVIGTYIPRLPLTAQRPAIEDERKSSF